LNCGLERGTPKEWVRVPKTVERLHELTGRQETPELDAIDDASEAATIDAKNGARE